MIVTPMRAMIQGYTMVNGAVHHRRLISNYILFVSVNSHHPATTVAEDRVIKVCKQQYVDDVMLLDGCWFDLKKVRHGEHRPSDCSLTTSAFQGTLRSVDMPDFGEVDSKNGGSRSFPETCAIHVG